MTIKYAIFPGHVRSQNDGDRHYINAKQLMLLYGVRPEECYIYSPQPWWKMYQLRDAEERIKGLIRLEPSYDGNYTIPTT